MKSRLRRYILIPAFGIIVGAILLVLIGLSPRRTVSKLSLSFLQGRSPVVRMDDQNRYGRRQVTDIYSFAGDFNDVCAKANTELTSLGFVEETRPGDKSRRRKYRLVGKRLGEFSTVTIMDNHKCSVYSTPANSEYSSPDVQSYHYSDGSVAVEVSQTQRTAGWLQSMRRWLRGPLQGGSPQP